MGAGWPIAFVWAHLHHAPVGAELPADSLQQEIDGLRSRLADLERQQKPQA